MENIETLLAAVAQTHGFDDDDDDNLGSSSGRVSDGAPSEAEKTPVVAAPPAEATATVPPTKAPASAVVVGGEKRKRGRPPRGQAAGLAAKSPPAKRKKQEEQEEEDVCFICFDGGSLVLCDRKGCPKAYHPACIKRDEAFFRSKAKWNCGWHICSVCQKASHYMCYTCTYSLCKGCTKKADYVCVRGNKGFCTTCMKTIMLIENKDQASNESVQVDFDDRTSWEYLFKVYWILLKEKLSLTLTELTQAKRPSKGLDMLVHKPHSTYIPQNTHVGKVSVLGWSPEHLMMNKQREQLTLPNQDPFSPGLSSISKPIQNLSINKGMVESNPKIDASRHSVFEFTEEPSFGNDESKLSADRDLDKSSIERETANASSRKEEEVGSSSEWASKDLLEFVAHMKNGDTSVLSQFDVQSLLLDYINRNNLRDPHRKSQIICDFRLQTLFGKPRVGHFEMLKLLEFHFTIKEDSQKSAFIPAGIVGAAASDLEVDGINYESLKTSKTRKRKARKNVEETRPQANLDAYAAIDVHNVNLIFIRRNLMENLIEDKEKFHDNVLGSIVRIRISTNDQKPDIYRLVQVVGTTKVAEPYKFGDKTVDIMLDVLNLDKKEAISIDAISNQEFTEDECRRLRQSIRCGLAKVLTVGEMQKKAMALQAVRLNDLLEAEISRLNHLRDRASEKGHKKNLRECIEKLQLLNSPEERQRRRDKIPEIHADPKMNPDYESEDNANNRKQDKCLKPTCSGFAHENTQKHVSLAKKGKEEGLSQTQNKMNRRIGVTGSPNMRKDANQLGINPASGEKRDQAILGSRSGTSTATISMQNLPYANSIERQKLWHYRDPSSKIQGPFSIVQLRKWSATGLFPPDMRIWTNNEQYDSVLLTDALNGQFHSLSQLPSKPSQAEPPRASSNNELVKLDRDNKTQLLNNPSHLEQPGAGSNNHLVKPDSENKEKLLNNPSHSEQPGPSSDNQLVKYDRESKEQLSNKPSQLEQPGPSSDNQLEKCDRESKEQLSNKPSHLEQPGASSNNRLGNSDTESKEQLPNNSSHSEQPGASSVDQLGKCERESKENMNGTGRESKPSEVAGCSGDLSVLPESGTEFSISDKSGSSSPQSGGLLKDNGTNSAKSTNLLPPSTEQMHVDFQDRGKESSRVNDSMLDINSSGVTENQIPSGHDSENQSNNQVLIGQPSVENFTSPINLNSSVVDSSLDFAPLPKSSDESKQDQYIDESNLPSPTPKLSHSDWGVKTVEKQQTVSSDFPMQNSDVVQLPSSTPQPNYGDTGDQAADTKQSVITTSSDPNPGPNLSSTSSLIMAGVQLPDIADEWGGYSPTPGKPLVQDWGSDLVSAPPVKPPEVMGDAVITSPPDCVELNHSSPLFPSSVITNWQDFMNERIELDVMGEESVSDLLAEVDAMESQGCFPSPTSGVNFSNDDCFSSIGEFSPTRGPVRSDAFSSTAEMQLTCHSSSEYKQVGTSQTDAFDLFRRAGLPSSASSEGETNAPLFRGKVGLEFHSPTPNNTSQNVVDTVMTLGTGSEPMDPGWGTVQGNINMVTVQGNVNLVLGGNAQGIPNLGWGTNPMTPWGNPNMNRNAVDGSLPWDNQRKYGGERFAGARDWGYQGGDMGFGRGRPPWGRQPYGGGGGGYSRPLPKGQRVCKFYESGRCKKGAFCDYLHP